MKRLFTTFCLLAVSLLPLLAQDALLIKMAGGITNAALRSSIDEILVSEDATTLTVKAVTGESCTLNASDIEQMTHGAMPAKLSVKYSGTTASVVNPYFLGGVSVKLDGAHVTVTNTNELTEYFTELSGETTDGSFTYNGTYKTTITLAGVSITSTKGAAIDIQCGKRVALELKKGTVNTLADCSGGKQKAALYCKGHLEIDKTGTLNVTGNTKHAISAKEYIQLKKSDGTINILGAAGDGIHCGQYYLGNGYTVNISGVLGDGIQAEASLAVPYEEDYPDGSLTIQGGTYDIKVTESFMDAIKADGDVVINSLKSPTTVTISATGDGSRGISSNGSITISDDATVVGIDALGKGGFKAADGSQEQEEQKSYTVYVATTTGGGMGGQMGASYWTTMNLYKADGTFVKQLTDKKTITGTNGQSLTFYYHDFGQEDSGEYYFRSADYTSRGQTYQIVSASFSGPTSGIDYYYQISSSYTSTTGKRTFQLSSVQQLYGGGTTDAETGDNYYAACLKADKDVTISGGTVKLRNTGLMSKAVKAGNSENIGTFTLSGGSVTADVTGTMNLNGTDATYCSAIKTDHYVGTGGQLTVNATTGTAIHALSADESILITDGEYNITNTSNGQSGTNDNYTAKALSCDKDITIEGGTFVIRMSGTGGKGIKADGQLIIGRDDATGPTIDVATTGASVGGSTSTGGGFRPGGFGQTSTGSSSKAIKAVGAATIKGGSLTVSTKTDGAEGLESKTSVLISGGTHTFECYDDCINSAGIINFAGGTTACYTNGNDAVDSNYGRTGAITISGGNIFAYTSKGSPEEGLDCDNNSYIVITGGIAVSAGGNQGGGSSSSVGSSTQGYYLGSQPSSYGSTYYYTLCNTTGTPICTYRFKASVSSALNLLTAPTLGKGTITVKYGTDKPTAFTESAGDVFFINPTVTTTGTTATLTSK